MNIWTNILNPDEVSPKEMHPVAVLFVAAIISAIASAISTAVVQTTNLLLLPVMTFVAIFLGGLYVAFIIMKVSKVIGGRENYYNALFSIAYPAYIISVGFLIFSVLAAIGKIGGTTGVAVLGFIGGIIALPIVAVGAIALFRYLHDLLKLDWIQTFILWSVIMAPIIVAPLVAILSMIPFLSYIGAPVKYASTSAITPWAT